MNTVILNDSKYRSAGGYHISTKTYKYSGEVVEELPLASVPENYQKGFWRIEYTKTQKFNDDKPIWRTEFTNIATDSGPTEHRYPYNQAAKDNT